MPGFFVRIFRIWDYCTEEENPWGGNDMPHGWDSSSQNRRSLADQKLESWTYRWIRSMSSSRPTTKRPNHSCYSTEQGGCELNRQASSLSRPSSPSSRTAVSFS